MAQRDSAAHVGGADPHDAPDPQSLRAVVAGLAADQRLDPPDSAPGHVFRRSRDALGLAFEHWGASWMGSLFVVDVDHSRRGMVRRFHLDRFRSSCPI